MPVQFHLPFTSSAFAPLATLPSGLRWFAAHQPFTLVIDALRGLLLGTPNTRDAGLAVALCIGLALVGYLWARDLQPQSRTLTALTTYPSGQHDQERPARQRSIERATCF